MLKRKKEQKGLPLSEKEPQTYYTEQGKILADSRPADCAWYTNKYWNHRI